MSTEEQSQNGGGVATATDTLTITDNRTGKTYELPIQDGTIRAMDLRQIKVSRGRLRADDLRPGVHEHRDLPLARSPTSTATRASCDYRGYPIEQLAEKSDYLEVAYLLVYGELPTSAQLDELDARDHDPHDAAREHQEASWRASATTRTRWGCCWHGRRAVDVLSRRQADQRPGDRATRRCIRLIAKVPTLAAFAYRHSIGQPYVYPDNDLQLSPATS